MSGCLWRTEKFEKKWQSEPAAGSVSKNKQFEYSWCLAGCKYRDGISRGIVPLEELVPHMGREQGLSSTW